MIHYFCKRRYADTILVFLALFQPQIAPKVSVVPYEYLHRIRSFRPGSFIFADIDRLSKEERERASDLHQALGATYPGCLTLNDPRRSLLRFDLLRRLFASGVNDFNVYRIDERAVVRRFPVFVRHELGHSPILTGLLQTPGELAKAIDGLAARGPIAPDLMIVEFGGRPGGDGLHRRYSAQRVADVLYPQLLFRGTDWMVKYHTSEQTPDAWRETVDYRLDAAHEAQLRQAFEMTAIDYGRADFTLVDGRVQVFEINTNPIVVASRGGLPQQIYADRHDAALAAIDVEPGGPAIPNPASARSWFWSRKSVAHAHQSALRHWERKKARSNRRSTEAAEA